MKQTSPENEDDFGFVERTSDSFTQFDIASLECVRYEEFRKKNSFLRAAESIIHAAECLGDVSGTQMYCLDMVKYYIDHDFSSKAAGLISEKLGTSAKVDVFEYVLTSSSDASIDILRELFTIDDEVATKRPDLLGKLATIKIANGILVNENMQILESLKEAETTTINSKYRTASYREVLPALKYFYENKDFESLRRLARFTSVESTLLTKQTIDEIIEFENSRNEDGFMPPKFRNKFGVLFIDYNNVTMSDLKKIISEIDRGNREAVSAFEQIGKTSPIKLSASVRILYDLMGGKTPSDSDKIKKFKDLLDRDPMAAIRQFEESRSEKVKEPLVHLKYTFDLAMILARKFEVDPREEDLYDVLARIELLAQTIPSDKDRLVRSKNILGQIELYTDTNAEFLDILNTAVTKLDATSTLKVMLELLSFTDGLDETIKDKYMGRLYKTTKVVFEQRVAAEDIGDSALIETLVEYLNNDRLSLQQFKEILEANRAKTHIVTAKKVIS